MNKKATDRSLQCQLSKRFWQRSNHVEVEGSHKNGHTCNLFPPCFVVEETLDTTTNHANESEKLKWKEYSEKLISSWPCPFFRKNFYISYSCILILNNNESQNFQIDVLIYTQSVTVQFLVKREVKQNMLSSVPATDSHPNYFGMSLLIGEIYS